MSEKEIKSTQETTNEEVRELTGSDLEQGTGGNKNAFVRRRIKKILKDIKDKESKEGGATGSW